MAIESANVTTVVGNVYVSSGSTAVTFLSLCNVGASNVTANVHVVPSGDSADATNLVLIGLDLLSSGANQGDTYQLYAAGEKLLLGNGDSIQASASANTVTTVTSFTSI